MQSNFCNIYIYLLKIVWFSSWFGSKCVMNIFFLFFMCFCVWAESCQKSGVKLGNVSIFVEILFKASKLHEREISKATQLRESSTTIKLRRFNNFPNKTLINKMFQFEYWVHEKLYMKLILYFEKIRHKI